MKYTFLFLLAFSIISNSAVVVIGDPEVSGCAPIGIG